MDTFAAWGGRREQSIVLRPNYECYCTSANFNPNQTSCSVHSIVEYVTTIQMMSFYFRGLNLFLLYNPEL